MICLVRPPAAETFRLATSTISVPLGLAYVAGALERAGYEVRVVDAVAEGPAVRTRYFKGFLIGIRLEDIVARIPPDASLVGISVLFTHEWPAAVRLIELMKRARPNLPIVVGGEHVSAMPDFSLLTSKADFVVLGEGEDTAVELADALRDGGDLSGVLGLGYRENGAVVINARRPPRRDVDGIARPAWHLFDLPTYNEHRFVGGMATKAMTIPILGTRGCPYQCTYCSAPNMWTPRWFPRDPIKVVDEIEDYYHRYGGRHFPFEDLTAVIQKEWIHAFCTELQRRKLEITWQFPTGTRCEAVDPESASLMKRSGLVGMTYAPESGSETTRRLIKKKMKTEHLFASIRSAVGAGLDVNTFMIIGFPHDTADLIQENFAFLERLAEEGVSDIAVNLYMALPGTELFHSLYDAGKLKIDQGYFSQILQALWLIPSHSHCDQLSRFELALWKSRMVSTFYRARRRVRGRVGPLSILGHALDGLMSGEHTSRLQTAARTAFITFRDTTLTKLKPGWIPRGAEKEFFAGWDDVYRAIRREKLEQGLLVLAPSDTTELHRRNVVNTLRGEHQTRRVLPTPTVSNRAADPVAAA